VKFVGIAGLSFQLLTLIDSVSTSEYESSTDSFLGEEARISFLGSGFGLGAGLARGFGAGFFSF